MRCKNGIFIFKKKIRIIIAFILLFYFNNIFSQNCDTVTTSSLNDIYQNVIINHLQNYVNASNMLNQVIKLDSTFVNSYYLLGKLSYDKLLESQNLSVNEKSDIYRENAIRNLKKTIEKCPEYDNYNSFYYLGVIYYDSDNYEKSLESLNLFISQNNLNETFLADANKKISLINDYYYLINNPVDFNPVLLDGVCSDADEFLPLVSPNGEFFFYTRRFKDVKNALTSNDYIEEFTFSTRLTSIDSCEEKYTTGEPMPYPFNDGRLQGGATITIDNNLMFITICEFERSYYTSYKNCDLFYTTFESGEWSTLKRVGKNVNNLTTFEGQPSITTDGKTVYFASNRDGGFGGFDIYKIIMNEEDDTWSDPINLGTKINTAGDEKTPFIHSDDKSLYYASNGSGGIGGFDIFMSILSDENVWSEPQNIGYPINTVADEVAFIISTNGQKIYFSYLKPDSETGWDICTVDLPKNVRPAKVLLLTGDITDELGNPAKNATVELTNIQTLESTEGLVNEETGKYAVSTVVELDDSFVLTVNSEGTFFDTYFIDPFNELYDPPTELDIQLHSIEKELPVELRTVNFETNSAELNETSIICIKKLLKFLEVNNTLIIEIDGHTDNVGGYKENLELSKMRAKAVHDYLIDNGIEKKRVSYQGFGESKPINSNNTDEGKADNRRVEFIVMD